MFELIGDHGQACPGGLKRNERLPDAGVDLGVIGDVAAIVGEVALEEPVKACRVRAFALGFKAALEQAPGALADKGAHGLQGYGRTALFLQDNVERRMKVRGAIHERPIEIKKVGLVQAHDTVARALRRAPTVCR